MRLFIRSLPSFRLPFNVGGGVLLATLSLTLGAAAPAQEAGPIVAVAGGQVQGARLASPGGAADGAVFKGIPFAQPPVQDLRWREPQPLKSWSGVRQTVEYGAPCAQNGAGWNNIVAVKSSEDCLYLNVWAPEWPAKTKKPVMLWLYGGGNSGGSAIGAGGIEPPFDGASLARHGVVIVTINYRLGVFGFMGHPELTAESPHHASGDYGLLDQLAALQWVHDNIAQFGGDPGNVTLFGQSAGARDTTVLLTSPLAKGLIQKAIAESGSPMSNDRHLQTPAQTQQLGMVLGEVLKAPSSGALQYLRSVPTADILAATQQYQKKLQQDGLTVDVGMDGYVVPQYSAEIFRSGKEAPLPMIFGSNGRDNPSQRIGDPGDTPEQRLAAVKSSIEAFYGKYPDLLQRALTVYGLNGPGSEVSTYPPYGSVDIQLGSDLAIRCATTVIVGWHSAVAPTYEYAFDAGTTAHPPVHSSELDFTFGYLRDQGSVENLRKLSDEMQQYWTNFAKTGDPNGPGLPKWPKYDVKSRQYIHFSNEGTETQSALRNVPCGIYATRLNRDLDARAQ
jgi:para-nitrobenzyl esterase